jgi:hypothetical protein
MRFTSLARLAGRLDLAQPGISFHEVVVNEYSLFTYRTTLRSR